MQTIDQDLLSEMGIYIQKSKTFLWPILNIKVQPIETYLYIGNVDLQDNRVLIALFHNKNESYLRAKPEIEKHPQYDFKFTDDEFDILIFNMYNIQKDFDHFVKGSYSKLSENFKLIMSAIEKNKAVLMCLNPENNYKEFARVLEVHEHELQGRELLSPPSLQQETMHVIPRIKQEIIEEFGLLN